MEAVGFWNHEERCCSRSFWEGCCVFGEVGAEGLLREFSEVCAGVYMKQKI